jgi:deoxyribodipyrimidine photo-lyase
MSPAIVWFRDDLRLGDNPALHAAAVAKRPLLCVFIDEQSPGLRARGGAMRWWLHGSLDALGESLARCGNGLSIFRGNAIEIVPELARAVGAETVFWNRRYHRHGRAIDSAVETLLKKGGIETATFNGHLLNEPWTVANKAGQPFRVFTAYWRAARARGAPGTPLAAPRRLRLQPLPGRFKHRPLRLASLQLEPRAPDWAGGLRAQWKPGESPARMILSRFLATGLPRYSADRDRPDRHCTSHLSPYLSFGNISVRQVWHAAHRVTHLRASPGATRQLEKFSAELGWREFNYHVLYHHPDLAERNIQSRFDRMRWRIDRRALMAWQRGLTGYPIVDAGMRELWNTGWMHNRVRMVTASFLVKHLLIDWRVGENWFWDTLVDADPANNAANWQWVAGSGADAAPYFRIFNPVLQGEKFDPDGQYVRRWVPELARLPPAVIHKPWTAKDAQLLAAGVRLGDTYPRPIVDHDKARTRALMTVESLAQSKGV